MKNINEFIIERLKLSSIDERLNLNNDSKVKQHGVKVDTDYSYQPRKKQFTDDEMREIEYHAGLMKEPPSKIEMGRNGNIKLKWEDYQVRYPGGSRVGDVFINISKPDRYGGCYKIVCATGAWAAYEYPIGNNVKNKNGEFKLKDIETVFQKIEQVIDKCNLLSSQHKK
jgi:hypothetical protein